MAYVQVDVDIEDFDTDEVIDDLIRRIKSHRAKEKLTDSQRAEIIKAMNIDFPAQLRIKTLDDVQKFEHLLKVWDKYNSYQFEDLIKI